MRKKSASKAKPQAKSPSHVEAIRTEIALFFDQQDETGRTIGNAKYGVYAFYDYDGEPIYVGQTEDTLRSRIRRHLTNQRTDAVAMSVLDPFEVADIEMWPLFDLSALSKNEAVERLRQAEYTVFQKVLAASVFGKVLNEKDIPPKPLIELPLSFRKRIVPDEFFHTLNHPDTRIARRANTIASLARVISERNVSPGLRRTLVIQAERLRRLAETRMAEVGGQIPVEEPGEETGETSA